MNISEKNVWYALATFHQPGEEGYQNRNRLLWNRWVSRCFDEETKEAILVRRARTQDIIENELEPLSVLEMASVLEELKVRGFTDQELQCLDLVNASDRQHFDFGSCTFASDVNLNNFCFPLRANFDQSVFLREFVAYGAYFHDYGSFDGCTFHAHAHIGWAYFEKYGPFQNCDFQRYATFSGTVFQGGVDFSGSTISGHVDFDHVEFHESARFDRVNFCDRANFYKACFKRAAFRNARFADSADFDLSTFTAEADFFGTKFCCSGRGPMNLHYRMREREHEDRHDQPALAASFRGSRFQKDAGFENTEFAASSSFKGASFHLQPPHFFGAVLHQQMEWRGVTWPEAKLIENAGSFVDAYACLKLEMDRLKRHEDELNFFVLELQAKRILSGPLRGAPIAIFSWVADCGRSFARPLALLVLTWVAFVPVYFGMQGWTQLWSAVSLSLASTFGVLGFRRELLPASVLDQVTGCAKILSGVQTLLGAILLFLIGLSLRNRFRMK